MHHHGYAVPDMTVRRLLADKAHKNGDKVFCTDLHDGRRYTYRDVPLIDDCVARFECSIFAQHEAGNHVIFIGRVECFDHGRSEDPLVFHKGAYMMLTQSPLKLAAKGRIVPDALDEARMMMYEAMGHCASVVRPAEDAAGK